MHEAPREVVSDCAEDRVAEVRTTLLRLLHLLTADIAGRLAAPDRRSTPKAASQPSDEIA